MRSSHDLECRAPAVKRKFKTRGSDLRQNAAGKRIPALAHYIHLHIIDTSGRDQIEIAGFVRLVLSRRDWDKIFFAQLPSDGGSARSAARHLRRPTEVATSRRLAASRGGGYPSGTFFA